MAGEAVKLGEQQRLFARLISTDLLPRLVAAGPEIQFRLGECRRAPEQAALNAVPRDALQLIAATLMGVPGLPMSASLFAQAVKREADKLGTPDAKRGIATSLHLDSLAIDIDLFRIIDGGVVYLANTEDHRPFGEAWEKVHDLCRWGGRWGDGNHYSMEWSGRK